MKLKFKLNQKVKVSISGEEGEIMVRSECAGQPNQYYLYYKAANGRAINAWFMEDQIERMSKAAKKKPKQKKPISI